ncbi:XIAP-associated factor 1 [Aulostomus maculatus]
MEDKVATRTCGQCLKEVAEVNFALHETHCRRFLCLCPDCDETVPREQLSQHREEQHAQVKCSKCNKKMERCHLSDHNLDECVERLEACQYCDLELPWKGLDEHSLVCGSRTELCKDCGHYVTLRDQPGHQLTCSDTDSGSGPPPTISSSLKQIKAKSTVRCSNCASSFPAEDIEEHELQCVLASSWNTEETKPVGKEEEEDFSWKAAAPQIRSTYEASFPSNGWHTAPRVAGGDPNQISSCPHCHLALPVITLRWHEAKCQTHILLKRHRDH